MAKFSKAHYQLLAGVFKKADMNTDPEDHIVIDVVKDFLVQMLEKDNPKFDSNRFYRTSVDECPNPDVCGCKSTLGVK
jgi:hypothetical protein